MRLGTLWGTAAMLVLTGCSGGDAYPLAGPGAESLPCALDGKAAFSSDCMVERHRDGQSLFLTVRHPDGGFRRFEVLDKQQGLTVADGSRRATITRSEGTMELTVDSDRYRFPLAMAQRNAEY